LERRERLHGDSYNNNIIYILPKDELYSGGGYSYWYMDGLNINGTLVDTLQPDNVTSKTTNPSSIFWTNSYNYAGAAGPAPAGATGLSCGPNPAPPAAPTRTRTIPFSS